MDIECHEFDLGFGHVSDVDVGIGKHISDLSHELCTLKKVQFFGHTDMNGIHTRIISVIRCSVKSSRYASWQINKTHRFSRKGRLVISIISFESPMQGDVHSVLRAFPVFIIVLGIDGFSGFSFGHPGAKSNFNAVCFLFVSRRW